MTHNERRELKTATAAALRSVRILEKAVKVMTLMTHRINLLEWELSRRNCVPTATVLRPSRANRRKP